MNFLDKLSPLASHSVEGVVRFSRAAPGLEPLHCKCCDERGHVYARSLDLYPWYTTLPLHFGRGVDQFVYSNVLMRPNDYEGKRVRITVEVFDS
jgi:hypothetical protein